MLYVARSLGDDGLVPVFDLMNHHAEEIANVITRNDREAGVIRVTVNKDVPKGSQLFFSYHSGRNAKEIFRDYGFVEDYPTRWGFHAKGRHVEYIVKSEEGPIDWIDAPQDLVDIEERMDGAAETLRLLKERLKAAQDAKGELSARRKLLIHFLENFIKATRMAYADVAKFAEDTATRLAEKAKKHAEL